MPTIIDLCEAAGRGDLNAVKHAIEQERLDPNTLHPTHGTRAIDFAAEQGQLAIVDYLFSQQAILDANKTGARASFLHWICCCNNTVQRRALINWLHEEQRYLRLGDNIHLAHLDAVAGDAFDANAVDLHDGLSPLYYAVTVRNSHIPEGILSVHLDTTVFTGHYKGITLTWLLAACGQLDLLQSLVAKHPASIDLNAAPQADNHSDKGITLAWWLVAYKQWDLLQTLVQKCTTPIDLNAAPKANNHRNKGITIAMLLTGHKQWDLLQSLVAKHPASIDLNAAPQADNHLGKGITIAMLLTGHKQWDLLQSLVAKHPTSIDLNTAPHADNHLNKGVTLAWQLALDKQWDLLQSLVAKHPTSIDLNAAPQANNHPNNGITLAILLVKQNQLNLLEKCLEKYFTQENGHQELNKLITQHPNLTQLHQLIAYVDIKHRNSLFELTIQQTNGLTENFKEELTDLWNFFDNVEKNSLYYAETQEMKANVLLTLAKHPNIALWAVNNLFTQQIEQYIRFNPDAPLEEKLKAFAIAIFANIGRGVLCANLYLQLSNPAKINHQQPMDVTPADDTVTDDSQLQPPPSKRQKTEKTLDNTHAFFEPHQSSSSTSSSVAASSNSSFPTSSTLPENNR